MYPVAVSLWCFWATLAYKRNSHDPSFVTRYHFLFLRFKTDQYKYNLLYMLRGLLIAVVPLISEQGAQQILCMVSVLVVFGLVQAWLRPWRTKEANVIDAAINAALIVIILCASTMVTEPLADSSTEEFVQIYLSLFLAIALPLPFVAMLYNTVDSLLPARWGFFLSHHKAAAGSLARWLKMGLAQESLQAVFLDSDEVHTFVRHCMSFLFAECSFVWQLQNLDTLIGNAANSDVLLVIMTPKVLQRPWCAVELVTAYRSNVKLVPLLLSDQDRISDFVADSPFRVFSHETVALFTQYGITEPELEAAYHALVRSRPVLFPALDASGQQHAIKELCSIAKAQRPQNISAKARRGLRVTMRNSMFVESFEDTMLNLQNISSDIHFVYDPSNSETVAAASIISALMPTDLQAGKPFFTAQVLLFSPDRVSPSLLCTMFHCLSQRSHTLSKSAFP